MARLTPQFSAARAVREYTEKYYLPCAGAFRKRAALQGIGGEALVNWRHKIAEHWRNLHFGHIHVETSGDFHNFAVQVYLDELEPDYVLVELFAQGRNGKGPFRHPMTRGETLVGSVNSYMFHGQVPASRPPNHYTPRFLPAHPDAILPLEASQITWQR